ncbi:MAG: hypothetical protein U0T77_00985 [Chitinophagales bacterium]
MSHTTEILDELKAISPVLFHLKEKEQPLSIPEAYFEKLSAVVLEHIQEKPGILQTLHKQQPIVPEGYFDSLAASILTKIQNEASIPEEGKIVPLFPRKNTVLQLFSRVAVAASVAGLVVVLGSNLFNKQPVTTNDCQDGIACLTQEEIYNYMYKNSYDFDVHQVQDMVKPELSNTEKAIEINKQDINQYIEQNAGTFELEDASTDIF